MSFSKTSCGVREFNLFWCPLFPACELCVSHPAHAAFPATCSSSLFLLLRIMDCCCASQSGRWQPCFPSLEFSFLTTWEHSKHLVCACAAGGDGRCSGGAQHWLEDGTAIQGVRGAASCTSGACWLQHPWKYKPFTVAHSWECTSFLNHWLLTAKKWHRSTKLSPKFMKRQQKFPLHLHVSPVTSKARDLIYVA